MEALKCSRKCSSTAAHTNNDFPEIESVWIMLNLAMVYGMKRGNYDKIEYIYFNIQVCHFVEK